MSLVGNLWCRQSEGKAAIDEKEQTMNKAITKLQKVYRGHKTRLGLKNSTTDFECSSAVVPVIPKSVQSNKIVVRS